VRFSTLSGATASPNFRSFFLTLAFFRRAFPREFRPKPRPSPNLDSPFFLASAISFRSLSRGRRHFFSASFSRCEYFLLRRNSLRENLSLGEFFSNPWGPLFDFQRLLLGNRLRGQQARAFPLVRYMFLLKEIFARFFSSRPISWSTSKLIPFARTCPSRLLRSLFPTSHSK